MKFLLDTHVIVWLAVDPARVSASVAERLRRRPVHAAASARMR